ncbi:MAG: UvrB/UvrC motif-containing protein [Phycisphaerales bacterium]
MKCDRCQNEATVHEVTVHKGKKVEKHLCEQCAKTDGIAIQSHPPIAEMLSKFVMSSVSGEKPARGQAACEGCGLTYAEFRQSGLLGCEQCYDAFEEQLGPLLERAQEGGSHHVGKTPRRGGGALDRGKVVATLRRQLLDAIAAEHYEKAAELRDRLRSVGAEEGPAGDEVSA